MLRVLFYYGWIDLENAPRFLSYLTLAASVLASVSVFALLWRFTQSLLASIVGVLVLQLMPIFWVSSVFPFPSIVSLTVLLWGLLIFDTAVAEGWRRWSGLLCVAAGLLLVLSTLLKVDAVLAAPIFCLPIWRSHRPTSVKVYWTLGLAVFSVLVLFIFDVYARGLTTEAAPLTGFDNQFPMDPANLVKYATLDLAARALGGGFLPLGVVGFLWMMRGEKTLMFWLLAASAPLFFFWGLRPPNEARHWLIPAVFFLFLLVLPLKNAGWRRGAAVILIVVAGTVSYTFFPATDSTAFPSGRLFSSSKLIRTDVITQHQHGCAVANSELESVGIVVPRWIVPYYKYEILKVAPTKVQRQQKRGFAHYRVGSKEFYVWDRQVPPEVSDLHELAGRADTLVMDEAWVRKIGQTQLLDVSEYRIPDSFPPASC
ncbi:MAG: hypothetical protein AAF438_05240 [Pseudomonadota bacterium]